MKNHIPLTQKHTSHRSKNLQRRAVAPVIATLLLVAIAVVGGSIIFVFSQGFFSTTQISGLPQPELVKIVGYDTRDVSPLKIHNGLEIDTAGMCCGDDSDKVKTIDERITIFIQNHSSQPITIKKFSFGGVEYQYTVKPQLGNFKADPIGPQPGEYVIMNGPDGKVGGDLLQNPTPTILGGEIVTFVLDLDRTLSNGRDMQINLATSNGNLFISTLIVGQDLS